MLYDNSNWRPVIMSHTDTVMLTTLWHH